MKYNELCRTLSDRVGRPWIDCSDILDELSTIILQELVKGNRVFWNGLGSFGVKEIPERQYLDESTKKIRKSKPYKRIVFKQFQSVTDALVNAKKS